MRPRFRPTTLTVDACGERGNAASTRQRFVAERVRNPLRLPAGGVVAAVELRAVDDHLARDERHARLVERQRSRREAPPRIRRRVVGGAVARVGRARRVSPDQELRSRPRPRRRHACRDGSRRDLRPCARDRVEGGAVAEHTTAGRPVAAPDDEPRARPGGGCRAAPGDRCRGDPSPAPRARVVERAVARIRAVARGSAPDDEASTRPHAHAAGTGERRIGSRVQPPGRAAETASPARAGPWVSRLAAASSAENASKDMRPGTDELRARAREGSPPRCGFA